MTSAAAKHAVAALPPALVRCQRSGLVLGAIALAILIAGGASDPAQFFRAYLPAYLFFLGIALGAMVLLMIYHITGGAWGFLIRRILEAATGTLPLLALGFLPIAAGVSYLYPWARAAAASDDVLRFQQHYFMNPPFFFGRAAAYFVLWLTVAFLLNAWSRAQDRTGNPWLAWRLDGLSGAGLVIYGITIHFASIDWLMSLQPAFHSTIVGPLAASGHLLSALAVALIVLAALRERPPLADILSAKTVGDLGSLLLSFLIVWAYMCWFQYMLVWMANLPVDVIWYLPRLAGGWQWVALVLVALHFVLPFVLLLLRAVKQNLRALARISGLLLVMHLVFMSYQVAPAFAAARSLADYWMDFVAPVALGGLWSAFFLWRLARRPLLPAHDLNAIEAARLRRADEAEAALEESLHPSLEGSVSHG